MIFHLKYCVQILQFFRVSFFSFSRSEREKTIRLFYSLFFFFFFFFFFGFFLFLFRFSLIVKVKCRNSTLSSLVVFTRSTKKRKTRREKKKKREKRDGERRRERGRESSVTRSSRPRRTATSQASCEVLRPKRFKQNPCGFLFCFVCSPLSRARLFTPSSFFSFFFRFPRQPVWHQGRDRESKNKEEDEEVKQEEETRSKR